MIETDRLVLRRFMPSDRAPFAALNQDPEVMTFFPKPLEPSETDAMIARIDAHFEAHGFGVFAVEVKRGAPFIGFVGLWKPSFEAHFTPCVEIGWRLSRNAWGHGYASEAARACLQFGFQELALDEIVSFTVPNNLRSRAVMERIGLERDLGGDFDHPGLVDGHPLRRHVLYRITRASFNADARALPPRSGRVDSVRDT